MADEKIPSHFIPEAYQNPTVYSNRAHILTGPVMSKIVFGEETVPGTINWRISIVTTTDDARATAILMAKLLKITAADLESGDAAEAKK